MDACCPSCEERGSGRIGDATRGRIDALAEGWKITEAEVATSKRPLLEPEEASLPAPRPEPPGPLPKVPPRSEPTAAPQAPQRPKVVPLIAGDAPAAPALGVHDETVFDPRSPAPERLASVEPLAPESTGIVGDVRYAFVVTWRLLRGRKELGKVNARLQAERAERARRLIEVARSAVGDVALEHPSLRAARDRLADLEDDRAKHDAAAADAEEESRRADEEHEAARSGSAAHEAALVKAIDTVEGRLRPLEEQIVETKKGLDDLRAQLGSIDRRTAALEKRITAGRKPEERSTLEADLAAARAERQGLVIDEPKLITAVATLEPEADALRRERDRLRADLRQSKEDGAAEESRWAARASELRERRTVEETARREAEEARDAELQALGEILDRERPRELANKFRPADEHASAIASIERRILEIQDAAATVDRGALYRGIAVISVAIIGLGVVAGLLLK